MPFEINFRQLAESIDIYAVAKLLGINVVKDRAACPVCEADRALQFFPYTNTFQCHAAGETNKTDCISLYAHVKGVGMYQAAKALHQHFSGKTVERETPKTPQPSPFNPDEYLQKLQYTDEVSALGISEEDAQRLGIGTVNAGFHKGRIVFAIRDESGQVCGFVGVLGTDLKVPKQWLPSKVVKLRRA